MGRAYRGTNFVMGEDAMQVLAWALAQRTPPTIASIMEKWPVCRATAYRWLPRLAEHRAMVDLYVERIRAREPKTPRASSGQPQEPRLQ